MSFLTPYEPAKHNTFHVFAQPYSASTKEYSTCAFTQGVIDFCSILIDLGHTVYHYGHAKSRVRCTQHFTLFNDNDLREWFGADYVDKQEWKQKGFCYESDHISRKVFRERALKLVTLRNNDWICTFDGSNSLELFTSLWNRNPSIFTLEPQIGYMGAFCSYRIYTSYSLMDRVGMLQSMNSILHEERLQAKKGEAIWDRRLPGGEPDKPNSNHAVIPYCFDPKEYKIESKIDSELVINGIVLKPGYVLYLARVALCKGIIEVINATKMAGKRLVVAGPGGWNLPSVGGDIQSPQQAYLDMGGTKDCPPHVTFVGVVAGEDKAKIIAGSECGIIFAKYIEAFGKISVEFNLMGKPFIGSKRGGYVEVIEEGVNGYLCDTQKELVGALLKVGKIKERDCKKKAQKYTLKEAAKKYQAYFERVWKSIK